MLSLNENRQRTEARKSQNIEVLCHYSSEEAARVKKLFDDNAKLAKVDATNKKLKVLKREPFYRMMHSMFGLTNVSILDGVFRAFNVKSPNHVERPEFLLGVSTMTRGTFEERIEFAWHVYDVSEDDQLTREEMYLFLKDSIVMPKGDGYSDYSEEKLEAVNDLIEMLFRQLDVTSDGRIDKSDFFSAVRQKPELLQCMGQIFPSEEKLQVFETAFGDESQVVLD